ncbi:MAG: phenylalanine--tRNA ligase subunit alpha [Saprospiraceae bacterium]|nr:phenylalanine--tRNA ligase subunit alpha [Candidatus Defluviibacterium haderslevense]
MKNQIILFQNEIEKYEIIDSSSLENYRIEFLSKKGLLQKLFDDFKSVSGDQKKELGQRLNQLKYMAESKYLEYQKKVTINMSNQKLNFGDLTLPEIPDEEGTIHPLSQVLEKIIKIFSGIGYDLSDGPEIEEDWYNFTALNFPQNHPARDMQDSFFIQNPGILLRTHTSNSQVRVMESGQLPIRTISPGRVYRNEVISARAHCLFHQVEGLYVNKNVNFKELKDTIYYFVKAMYGDDTKVRFRPSFFPFTEPSAEVDISCLICHGLGCNVCKYSGWVEIMGCGMVDPNVLENCKINSKEYSGFAFGMGLERITMLHYQIKDLRLFFENDLRFLNQFVAQI